MILAVIRVLFISLVAAVALAFLSSTVAAGNTAYIMMVASVITAIAVIMLDFFNQAEESCGDVGIVFRHSGGHSGGLGIGLSDQ